MTASGDFLVKTYVRGRPAPFVSQLSEAEALEIVAGMAKHDIAKMFGVDKLPERALRASRDLLRVAALTGMCDRTRRESDDFVVSFLGGSATSVRCAEIDVIEIVDLDSLPEPEQRPYRASRAGFSPRRLAPTEGDDPTA